MSASTPLISNSDFLPNDILFSDTSGKLLYENKPCHLQISLQSVSVQGIRDKDKLNFLLQMKDICGIQYQTTKKSRKYQITIYTYPIKPNSCTFHQPKDGVLRISKHYLFQCSEELLCQQIESLLITLIHQQPVRKDPQTQSILPPQTTKHYLVFINPVGGKRIAMKLWRQKIETFLQQSHSTYQLIVTQYANHAKEYVLSHTNLLQYYAIMVIGGDGLIFEIVNGIAERSDGEMILSKLPIAAIPGGSGNGLAKSIAFESNEAGDVLNTMFIALKGSPSPIDMSLVTTKSGHQYRSFLSLTWGLISDIDINSEFLRCLGESRLYLTAVYYIIRRRFYNGIIKLKLVNSVLPQTERFQSIPINQAQPQDTYDNDWLVIQGSILLFFVINTTHVASSFYSGPGITMNNQVMTIYVVQAISRVQMLQVLLSADEGGLMGSDCVRVFQCTEYILEPLSKDGIFSLDGEVIEYGPINGKILPHAGCILKL